MMLTIDFEIAGGAGGFHPKHCTQCFPLTRQIQGDQSSSAHNSLAAFSLACNKPCPFERRSCFPPFVARCTCLGAHLPGHFTGCALRAVKLKALDHAQGHTQGLQIFHENSDTTIPRCICRTGHGCKSFRVRKTRLRSNTILSNGSGQLDVLRFQLHYTRRQKHVLILPTINSMLGRETTGTSPAGHVRNVT